MNLFHVELRSEEIMWTGYWTPPSVWDINMERVVGVSFGLRDMIDETPWFPTVL